MPVCVSKQLIRLKRAMHGDDSDDDGILQKRVKTEEEKVSAFKFIEDMEYSGEGRRGLLRMAQGQRTHSGEGPGLGNRTIFWPLLTGCLKEKLKKRWSSQNLDKDEQFLRDYLLNRQYEEGDVDDQ